MQPVPASAPVKPELPDEFEAAYDEQTAAPEPRHDEQMRQVAQSLGLRLSQEYARRRAQRQQIEQRWLKDIEHYNGVYSPEFAAALKERKYASQVFVPIPRRVCNIVEARLGDLLFPTDDRNFVVEASPHPELADAEGLAKRLPPDHPVNAGGVPVAASAVATAVRDLIDEAKSKAINMQRTIDDQLQEANYSTEARKAIHDAIKIGTGILKGPMVLGRTKKAWTVKDGVSQLVVTEDLSPTAVRVDPWNFYPDLSASWVEESAGFFELHRLNKSQLARLAKQPGFDGEAIARIWDEGSARQQDANLDATRLAAGTVGVDDNRFNLVEYTGPVDAEELIACGCDIPDAEPLMAYDAVIWFSEFTGEPVKAILNPMDTDAQPYAVFNWQPDAACIFGYGLPYEIRDLTESANSAFRAAMDNMGLTVGPQVVVNDKRITPANGSWVIEPNKIWRLSDASQPVGNVFGFFQIDSKVNELLAIFNLAKGVAEEIGGPAMAMQGTEAPSYVQAGATGMAIAYNAANIWMRRAVKLWDDQVTTPLVGRFIDWNMQYNPDPDIKGDLCAVARGTSGLLAAEGQVSRIQLLAELSAKMGVPLRNMIGQLRQMASAMRLDPDECLPSEEEVQAMEAQKAQQGPPPNPEVERIQMRKMELEDRAAERQFQAEQTDKNNQIRLAELAQKEHLTLELARQKYGLDVQKTAAELHDRQVARAHDAQKFNTEIAVKATQGSGI